uniref:Growth arrest and DNA damage inducible beta n=1 Tax=Crocodylus porosus TaxID=8502 RepID=A0A7M4FDY3_CROPO
AASNMRPGAQPGPPGRRGLVGRGQAWRCSPGARALLPEAGRHGAALCDPDSVVLCLLAMDEEDEDDIALQIHFTLIQAFCCDNDIHILRVSGMQRLATLLGEGAQDGGEPRDLHCILVTNPHTDSWKSQGLAEVASYCEESRCNNQWVPSVALQER